MNLMTRSAAGIRHTLCLLLTAFLCHMPASVSAFDEGTFRQRLQEALELSLEQNDSLRFLRADLEAHLALLRSQVLDGELLAIEGRLRYREVIDSYRIARPRSGRPCTSCRKCSTSPSTRSRDGELY